jgi:hypothetical protein
VTLTLGIFLLPTVMGLILVPAGVIYLIWAIRSFGPHRLSAALAGVTSLIVALYLGVLVGSGELFFDAPSYSAAVPETAVAIGPDGRAVVLDRQAIVALEEQILDGHSRDWAAYQTQRRVLVGWMLFLAALSVGVVVLHGLWWRELRAKPAKTALPSNAN